MNTIIKGAKAGSGSARKAVIAPDSAQSKTYIKILYGLSEGKIKGLVNGLQSIYLDDTPLHDANSNPNFENVTVDTRDGTNDQSYIEGFPDISSETAIGVELKSEASWVRAFTNLDLDAVRVRFRFGPLREQNAENGDVNGITIRYALDVQTDGGTWTEVLNTQISDKTSTNYERSHRIDLPKADFGWQIRIRRLTPNANSEYISDKMYVQAITEVIDAKLRYPNTALLGLQYDAETFSNVAKMAAECEGVEILLPVNYDPVTRAYSGMWDGTFKRAYSNNPAWHFYDACVAKRYALGDRINSSMIDKWSIYRLAQYCDQSVPDGKGGFEPRFTLNVYEQSQDDAWSVLSKMAGAFRAFIYWDGQAIVCDADMPQDTYFTYTRANVIEGQFEYSGTRARDRHTVAKVAWDNPANRYKTEYVFVRDEAAIARLGIRIVEIAAYGCTSEAQAQRAGHWALKSEQYETRTVTFKVGLDEYIPKPGKVIEVADELFAGRANGGRISVVSADLKSITLDRDDVVCRTGDRLIVNGENGQAQARVVQGINGRIVTVSAAFESVAAQNVWVLDAQDLATMKFRIISITQDDTHQFTINGLQYNPSKYDAIDHAAFIDERPISIVNPNLQKPVESVAISAETMVQQGLSIETMIIAWPQAEAATKYQVEWRKDDGSWMKLPITGNNSIEIQGIYSGNYQARVTAISAFDIASLPTYSILTPLLGKQGKPPKLASISATGILFGMRLNWLFPAMGALDTAYTEIEVSPDGVSNIAQLGLFAYPTTVHTIQGMQPNLTQKYRGRLIDRIGNIGDWSEWATGTTSADASAVLDLLSEKITETQLHQDLQTKIDHIETIDAEIGPIRQDIQNTKDQISQEIIDRQHAVQVIRIDLSEEISEEIRDRQQAIQQAEDGLTQKINDSEKGVLEVIDTVKKSSDDGFVAVQSDIKVVVGDLKLTAEKTDGVYAQLNPPLIGSESDLIGANTGFAGTWSVQSAIIEGDLALSKRLDTTVAQVNDVQAFAQQEVIARVEGQQATVEKIDTYIADNDTALATVRDSAKVAVDTSKANGELIQSLELDVQGKASTGQLTQVKSDIELDYNGKITAQTDRIDGVYAQINPPLMGSESDLIGSESGYAGVWSEHSARIEGDLGLSKRIEMTVVEINDVQAFAQQEVIARVEGQKATVEKIDTYIAENDTAVASVRDSAKVAVDTSKANGELIQSLELDLNGKASTGQLTQVKSEIEEDYNGKINAQTTKIDGVYAQINPLLIGSENELIGNENGYAGVWSEQSARIEGDIAQAKRTDQVIAEMQGNDAVYKRDIKANADATSANIKMTETLQTTVGENKASIEEVTESVDGLYAQKYIKLDVNGKVAGWGGANDGKESNFILNFDSFAIGSENSTGYYPFIFRNTPYTDPNTGTVFPVGAYLKTAFMDYASIKLAHIDTASIGSLSAVSATLGTLVTYKDPTQPLKARMIMQGSLITVYDDDNVLRVKLGLW